VNLAKIKEIEPIVKAGASARLESGQTIEISRRYAHELRQKLGW
jgi:DNA-binding LytR/AlgR family response regulator